MAEITNLHAARRDVIAVAALGFGAAAWAQLALVPLVVGRADMTSVIAAMGAPVILALAARDASTRPRRALALAAGGFPAALGVAGVVFGLHPLPRFDAPSRVIAALTLAAYLALVARWHGLATPARAVTLTPLDAPSAATSPTPRWQRPARVMVVAWAVMAAVVLPALLGSRAAFDLAGDPEPVRRGRVALVTAGGLAAAVAMTLGGAAALLRGAPARPRLASRAMAYLVWAALAFAMRSWLDRAR